MQADSNAPVRLRGHHLICLQFLHGDGYSEEFAHNVLRLRDHMEHAGIRVVSGHDDVCAGCPFVEDSVVCMSCAECGGGVDALDEVARRLLDLETDQFVTADELRDRMGPVLIEWQARACWSCAWKESCATAIGLLARS